MVEYRRSTLVATLIEHQRLESGACACGWAELGASYARHVALAYEEKADWAALIDGSISGAGSGSQDPSDEAQQRPLRGSMPPPAPEHNDGDPRG